MRRKQGLEQVSAEDGGGEGGRADSDLTPKPSHRAGSRREAGDEGLGQRNEDRVARPG